jgi:predicted transcriptional regulator of viral defense system
MGDFDRRAAELAAANHSIITLREFEALGGSARGAQRRVTGGRWEQLAPGVYRIAGVRWTYNAEVFAAVRAAGPGAVASHLCAARLHGIGFSQASPELSIPRGRRRRSETIRVHTSTDLDRCDVRRVDGIPVTDPSRTLLDVGRYLRAPALRRAVEAARRADLVTWETLTHTLAAHARQGRHGIRRLREVISLGLLTEGVTDTDSEMIALSLIREHGHPDPVLHHRVRDAEGELVAELDLAYPARKAAIEIDGTVHLDPAVRRKDEARDHHLRRLGWTIRRVWYEVPLREPKAFVQIVRSLLDDTAPSG